MMTLRLALLLALAGCSSVLDVTSPHVAACPHAPPAAPIPTEPRTFEAVVEWAQLTESARAATVRALEICRNRR